MFGLMVNRWLLFIGRIILCGYLVEMVLSFLFMLVVLFVVLVLL